MRVCLALIAALLMSTPVSFAGELREFYRGARAQAMGNAFVAIADDEQAIFMNPAGLAGIKSFTFNYVVADLQASWETVTSATDVMAAASSPSADTINVLMGKDIYTQAQITPSLVMPGFGFALIVDGQGGLSAENQALPQMLMGYQTTNGIQAAFGTSLLSRGQASRKKTAAVSSESEQDLRVGIAAKMLWRRGGWFDVPTMTILTINSETLSQLAGNFGRGYGVDLGAQYLRSMNKFMKFMAGVAYTDVGDTNFGNGPAPIKGNLSLGIAGSVGIRNTKITLALDKRHLLEQTDWRKKTHVGLEFGLPLVSLYAGISQVYLTYGLSFDLWLFKLTAASYAEEQGSFVHQDPVRRYMLRLGLKFSL